jgi:uncharacterized protein (TIGR00369 family)
MSDHVLGQLGLRFEQREGVHHLDLDLDPVHLDGTGQVDFGVLGVFLDMASSQPPEMRTVGPWVHADITIHRLRPPQGRVLHTTPRMARMGRRSGIVEIEVHDETGVHVARSVQEVTFLQGARDVEVHDDDGEARAAFIRRFTGACRLAGPLPEVLGVEATPGPDGAPRWTMPLWDVSRNGFGALHGGAATSLVDVAAAGAAVQAAGGTVTAGVRSAAIRYLAAGMQGPFVASPRVIDRDDAAAMVVVEVHDAGADHRPIILADAVVTVQPAG